MKLYWIVYGVGVAIGVAGIALNYVFGVPNIWSWILTCLCLIVVFGNAYLWKRGKKDA